MRTVVEWYRNGHEHRNDLLRFGFMRLHNKGEIRYVERPLSACVEAGFSTASAEHEHRHTSLFVVKSRSTNRRIVLDSEDSFVWLSPLIEDCDQYFCSGYSSDFFQNREFVKPYTWQTDQELAFYRERIQQLVSLYGFAFDKVRPFVFIAPNLAQQNSISRLTQKYLSARHKLTSRFTDRRDWATEREQFEARYASILQMRSLPRIHDVVLSDSLWGWPRHRVELHNQLATLSAHWDIHTRLNWAPPVECDASALSDFHQGMFPIVTGDVGNYEVKLASSRLGVFATGFHWGWRNIMAFALMVGLPVMVDRLVVEPWFDMKEFELIENEEFGMPRIESALIRYNDPLLALVKSKNQAAYDRLMSPEAVARYVLAAC